MARQEGSFSFELGRVLGAEMTKSALGPLGGAAAGAGIGGIVGAVEKKDDDKSRALQIIKRVLQGGAIGGAAGAVHTHGRISGRLHDPPKLSLEAGLEEGWRGGRTP